MTDLPPEAYAAALASLPKMSQAKLRVALEAAGGSPERAWRRAVAAPTLDLDGTVPRTSTSTWGRGLEGDGVRDQDVHQRWEHLGALGMGVWLRESLPVPRLRDDVDPPTVLFWQGRPEAVDAIGRERRPAVAIVGTRRCTAYGTDVARELGRGLAEAGVVVVSGLALGIDGAAHEGALAAGSTPPVGVVGSGLDVVYPTRHRTLWRRVTEAGLLLSEAPPGAPPEPWRFPRRNRFLAALADVVVVVESHASGGSLSTVRAALERDVAVMAVPGSVRSPSSAGTNRLLADGVAPVTDVQDVLVALSLEGAGRPPLPETGGSPGGPEQGDAAVLEAVDWTPTATEAVLRRTGLAVADVATRLTRLELAGLVRRRRGWWERVPAPGAARDGGYTATT